MKATLRFNDGVEIELSQETTDRLRRELIKEDGQLKVDALRARKDSDYIRIALMNSPDEKWDGLSVMEDGNAKANRLFTFSEVREIIKGLDKMLKEGN